MKVVRTRDAASIDRFAHDNGDGTVTICDGTPFNGLTPTEERRDLASLTLLAPVAPGKIIGVGLNYGGHAAEHGHAVPEIPLIFFKPPSAVIGPGETIRIDGRRRRTDAEAELVVVIGREASNVSEEDARSFVAGYTCGNDVSERDAQQEDNGWPGRSKGYDTFAPIGPCLVSELPEGARIRTRINGALAQDSAVDNLIFPVPRLISFISRVVTLLPGDLIFTGTPAGVSQLRPGDVVSVSIDGVGDLTNPVGLRGELAE